jgi:hypothetical protein
MRHKIWSARDVEALGPAFAQDEAGKESIAGARLDGKPADMTTGGEGGGEEGSDP